MSTFISYRCLSFIMGLLLTASPLLLHAAWEQPPHEFTLDSDFGTIRIASNNNVGLVVLSDGPQVEMYSFIGGMWTPSPVATFPLTTSFTDQNQLDLAMDSTGTALAIWADNSGVGDTAFYNGTSWSTPANNPLSGLDVQIVAIDMNGLGQGVASFIDNLGNVYAAFFSGSAWGLPLTIGTNAQASFPLSIAYSSNGNAVASWQNTGGAGVVVSNFIGGVWQPSITLDPNGQGSVDNVSMDASGNAIAIWRDASDDIVASTFNGSTWLSPQFVGSNGVSPKVDMAPGGTAVAAWLDITTFDLLSSGSFNGSVWSAPILATNDDVDTFSLSVNSSGNALIVYSTDDFDIKSIKLQLGSAAWDLPEIIQSPGAEGFDSDVSASFSDNGTSFAAWHIANEGPSPSFASVSLVIAPTPPVNIEGSVCCNQFASQTDRIHVITWSPSVDPTVVSYNLRRNGVLIATIPATGPFIYLDHNRCKNVNDVYSLTSVNAEGVESTPVTVTLR